MAATLALPTHPSDSALLATLVPPPSQDFAMHQVPDVFVIPPEEEQHHNPPWCYFEAASAAKQNLSTSPDVDALDVALSLCQQRDNRAPSFNRHFSNESQETIVMPRRGGGIGSFARLRDMDIDLAMEDGQTDIRSRNATSSGSVRSRKDAAYDEEIVEVVKVRRNEGMADVGDGRTLKMKKSNTFRARATQAFRSIKNVGKNSSSSSSSSSRRGTVSEPKLAPDAPAQAATTLPSRRSCHEPASQKPTPQNVNRRRSLTLSQMFAFKENHNSRPTSPIVDEPMSPTIPSYESSVAPHPVSPTDVSDTHANRLQPSSSLEDCMATPTRSPSPGLGVDDPSKPTLSKRKSFRRRLSVLELQKLFSIGGSSSNSQPEPAPVQAHAQDPEDLFSPSGSRPISMDSTAILSTSSSRTSSATLGDASSANSRRTSSSSQRTGSEANMAEDAHDADADLEMRLDSLHFDSLHIDPDELFSSLD
ncbi:hypothetical protein BV20DRAFT_1051354 [Pilatotrama ljubarskyi]|nr:hypothetical protein BV20DRAFT_1051354 [Pilatotrama ljubarskyi]